MYQTPVRKCLHYLGRHDDETYNCSVLLRKLKKDTSPATAWPRHSIVGVVFFGQCTHIILRKE